MPSKTPLTRRPFKFNGALREKLTALIGNRCFDDLRNLAGESGGMADSIGAEHTKDKDFLPWLDTLLSGSKIDQGDRPARLCRICVRE